MTWIKKSFLKTLIILLILFLCLETVSAATITVGPSGRNYTTINAAINSANQSDIIFVSDGVYNENVLVNKADLAIISENGSSSTTVISSPHSNHAFQVTASNATIRGFNITGGSYGGGAGIYATSVSNCTFSENHLNANHYGIYLNSSSNNMIKDNNASSNYYAGVYMVSSNDNALINNIANDNNYAGIFLMTSSSNNIFTDNNASSNYIGIQISHLSDNSLLKNNTVNSNFYWGITLSGCSNITLAENRVDSNEYGISIWTSTGYTLINNVMSLNNYNFEVFGSDLEHFLHDVDQTNLVDGKPLYYWVNRSDAVVPLDAGLVCLVNSTNITVRDVELSNGHNGILLAYTNSSTVQNVIASGNYDGVHLISSDSNTFDYVAVNNNGRTGVFLESSNNNRLSDIIASHNSGDGVYVHSSCNNLFDNIIANNNSKDGISLESSNNNILTHNIASNNSGCGVHVRSSENNTLNNNVANSNIGSINEWSGILEKPYGVYMYFSGNSTLSNNAANYNNNTGIYLRNSYNMELKENTVRDNGVYGFYDYKSGNTIVDKLVVTSDSAISFVTDDSEVGIAGNDTSSVTLSGKRNVSGYITIGSSSDIYTKFSYEDSGMSSAGESSIGLFRLNGAEWIEVTNTSLNTAENYVSVGLSEFGTFALFENPESPVLSSSSGSSLAARIRSQGTITDLPLGENGQVTTDTVVRSSGSTIILTLYEGTKAVDAYGNPVSRIIITAPASLPPETPSEVIESGLCFDLGPSGTIFSQDIMITMDFDPEKFEGRNPIIFTYLSGSGWVALDTTVDLESGRATAMISHFSLYALFGTEVEDAVVTTPVSEARLSAEADSRNDNGSASNHFYWIAGTGILLVIVMVLFRNRQKGKKEL